MMGTTIEQVSPEEGLDSYRAQSDEEKAQWTCSSIWFLTCEHETLFFRGGRKLVKVIVCNSIEQSPMGLTNLRIIATKHELQRDEFDCLPVSKKGTAL